MKKTILFLLFVSSTVFYSQNLEWAYGFGGNYDEIGTSIDVSIQKNVYSTGSFSGTVDFDPSPQVFELTSANFKGGSYITKFNESGILIWAKTFQCDSNSNAEAIKVDFQENVYVTGKFNGTIDFDPGIGVSNQTALFGGTPYIVKLNSDGNLIWVKTFNINSNDGNFIVSSITFDENNNLLFAGSFNGICDFNPDSNNNNFLVSNGNFDIFTLKLDSNGNFIWAKSIGGTGDDRANSIISDFNGNFFLGGFYNGTVDFDTSSNVTSLISNGGNDLFTAKFDTLGNLNWANGIGGSLGDSCVSINLDSAGNLLATGFFNGVVDFDSSSSITELNTNGFNSKGFVLKQNSSGTFLWAKDIGGIGTAICVDNNNYIYITGVFWQSPINLDFDPSNNVYPLSSVGLNDIFISKLDLHGNFNWARRIGGSKQDIPRSMDLDLIGNIYLTGAYEDTSDFDPNIGVSNLISNGLFDIFIAKISVCSFNSTLSSTNINCSIGSSGTATITPTNGTAPYTYQWLPTGGTNATATGLGVGTYTCTITDATGCTSSQSATITSTNSITTTLTTASCGATLAQVYSTIGANPVANTTMYQFEVTNTSTNNVQTLNRTQNYFELRQLNNEKQYNTTYSIRVRLQINGVWQQCFGNPCTVKTPTASVRIRPDLCSLYPNPISKIDSEIFTVGTLNGIDAGLLSNIAAHRYEITNVSTGVVEQYTKVPGLPATATNFMRFTWFTNYSYGTTYSVRVAFTTGSVGEDFGAYGPACLIRTPNVPSINQCGLVLNPNNLITVTAPPSVNAYRFKVVGPFGTQQVIDRNVPNFTANMITGYSLANQYTVSVSVRTLGINSEFSSYGPACIINPTTQARSSKGLQATNPSFAVSVYPNPSENNFRINLSTTSDELVYIKFYSVDGKLIEDKVLNTVDIDALEIGQNYASGLYNIIVSQGENYKTLHVIKK